jgi:hypothetical protein
VGLAREQPPIADLVEVQGSGDDGVAGGKKMKGLIFSY